MPALEAMAATAVLLLAFSLLVCRTPAGAAAIYGAAAVPQAVLAAALAVSLGRAALGADALAILAVKGFWAPRLLRRAAPGRGEPFGMQAARSAPAMFAGGAAVTWLSLGFGERIAPGVGLTLGLALAATFVGLGAAALRAELWCQATGLLMGEAGFTTTALVLVGGLAPAGEVLALGEVVFLAAVLAAASRRVREAHGSVDARLLRGLRG